jgi:alpha-glucoside transport system substrate-binding protein
MAYSTTRRGISAVTFALGLSLVLAACGGDDGDGGDGDGGGDEGTTGLGAGADCDALVEEYGDLSDTEITMYSTIIAPEDAPLEASFDKFEECTGATIIYEGSDEFEAQLPVRVEGGTPPDMAILPQPGLLRTLVEDYPDAVVPAPEAVGANLDEFFSPDWKAYGEIDGTLYATPFGANVKSFVWYSPTAFADAGYEVPETWDDMLALSDQIVADGGKPWCAGVSSGEATGWPATDWVEDVVLRTAGPEVYDQWYTHEIPFNDPQIIEAIDTVGEVLKNEDYVNGGLGDVASIATTRFEDGGLPITLGQCYMHRQASFYAANWPEGTEVAEDGDVFAFYLPPIDPAQGSPVLGGGEFVAAFSDRPEVQAFQAYMATADWHSERTAQGGAFVSANLEVPLDLYDDPIDRLSAEILQDEEAIFRFDASDLMPGAVGSGTFWTGMVDWLTGASTEEVADAIEESWPAS